MSNLAPTARAVGSFRSAFPTISQTKSSRWSIEARSPERSPVRPASRRSAAEGGHQAPQQVAVTSLIQDSGQELCFGGEVAGEDGHVETGCVCKIAHVGAIDSALDYAPQSDIESLPALRALFNAVALPRCGSGDTRGCLCFRQVRRPAGIRIRQLCCANTR